MRELYNLQIGFRADIPGDDNKREPDMDWIRIAGVPRQYGSDVNNPALEMRDKQSFTERERQ